MQPKDNRKPQGLGRVLHAFAWAVLFANHGFSRDLNSGITKEHIRVAWQARQELVRTFHFQWSGEAVYLKGSMFIVPDRDKANEAQPTVPQNDVVLSVAGSVWADMDAGCSRIEGNPPNWHAIKGFFYQPYKTCVTRGNRQVLFYGESDEEPDIGLTASIEESSTNFELCNHYSSMISATFRPLDARVSRLDLDHWVLAGEDLLMDGRPCLVLNKRGDEFGAALMDSQATETLVVDPSLAFNIVRYLRTVRGCIEEQTDIEYVRNDVAGWVPNAWTLMMCGGKDFELRVQYDNQINVCQVNTEMSRELFNLKFPPGTWVSDKTRARQWVVRNDGSERTITRKELSIGVKRSDLLSPSADRNWIELAFFGLLLSILVWFSVKACIFRANSSRQFGVER